MLTTMARRARRCPPPTADQGWSVAVMPFENLSGDACQDSFADGLNDKILTIPSRFQNLRVAVKHSN
jgi:TolB-like protein